MGYTYVGPTSFYRLALAEIRRLMRGYELWQRAQQGATAGVRESDWRALSKFKQKWGLE